MVDRTRQIRSSAPTTHERSTLMSANETEKTTTPRCGKETASGPCLRPQGHPATGHASEKTLRNKSRAKTPLTVEELEAAEKDRRATAAKIKAAKDAEKAKIEKLREAARALGFELTPITAEAAE